MERYLKLPKNRPEIPTYLVLIANRNIDVPVYAIENDSFLRPSDSSRHYFNWQDFFPVIASHEDRLSQDFASFMRHLGMAPLQLPGDWANLFIDTATVKQLDEAFTDTRIFFQDMGAHCQGGVRGFQVRRPLDWLHLLYISVEHVATPFAEGIESPFIVARFYVPESETSRIQHLKAGDVACNTGRVIGRTANTRADWNKSLVMTYECVGSLKDHIAETTYETRDNFLRFAQAAFRHVTISPS